MSFTKTVSYDSALFNAMKAEVNKRVKEAAERVYSKMEDEILARFKAEMKQEVVKACIDVASFYKDAGEENLTITIVEK